MVEYILTALVILVVLYALFRGCAVNINVTYRQEFSEHDRQLLEDIYNKEGDPDSKISYNAEFDNLIKTVNDIMLGEEEQLNE